MKLHFERNRRSRIKSPELVRSQIIENDGFNIETEVDEATWEILREALKDPKIGRLPKLRMQAFLYLIDPNQLHWKFDKKISTSLQRELRQPQKEEEGNWDYFPKHAEILTALKILRRVNSSHQEPGGALRKFFAEEFTFTAQPSQGERDFQTAVLFPETEELKVNSSQNFWEEEARMVCEGGWFGIIEVGFIKLVHPERLAAFEKYIPKMVKEFKAFLATDDKEEIKKYIHLLPQALFSLAVLDAEEARMTSEGNVIIQPKKRPLPIQSALPQRPAL